MLLIKISFSYPFICKILPMETQMQLHAQITSIHNKGNNFPRAHLIGKIGQVVIETYLLESGYDIYPYGYENNYANITRFVRKDYLDTTTTQIRSMPDLLVCDKDNNERFLLQIKTTSVRDESKYWIGKGQFDSYREYWAEALLTVYCISTGKIYCCKIADITNFTQASRPGTNEPGYFLNLYDFSHINNYLKHIDPSLCIKLHKKIEEILKSFSQVSA